MSGVGSKTPKSERKMELRLKNCHPMPDQCLYSSWLLKKGEVCFLSFVFLLWEC